MTFTVTMTIEDDHKSAIVTPEKGSSMSICTSASGAGWISICTLNSSHRSYRGAGRDFATWDDAIAAYKSAKSRAMIEAARDAIEGVAQYAS